MHFLKEIMKYKQSKCALFSLPFQFARFNIMNVIINKFASIIICLFNLFSIQCMQCTSIYRYTLQSFQLISWGKLVMISETCRQIAANTSMYYSDATCKSQINVNHTLHMLIKMQYGYSLQKYQTNHIRMRYRHTLVL